MENSNGHATGRPLQGCEFFDLSLYKFLIDSLPVAIFVLNSELKIIEANTWAEKLTGYPKEEVIGRYCGEVLRGELCETDCPLRKVFAHRKSVIQIETVIRTKSGATVPVRMTTAGLVGRDRNLIGGVEVFQDISDLKAQEREKANLISMFAHDMRSSLTGIHGLGLRLLNKAPDMNEEKQRQYLKIITDEAGKLESLVDDFLEFSRLQTGKLNLNFTAISLDKELIELYETYKVRASQSKVNLELKVDEALPIIEADANRLHRVFTNLLDNAVKFSRERQTVTIAARETKHEVMVKIVDRGLGIDSEELPYIFDLFHRGESPCKKEGYGIGLATVKAIVEGHGGRIHVASELNRGSVFTVFLPKHRENAEGKDLSISGGEGGGFGKHDGNTHDGNVD